MDGKWLWMILGMGAVTYIPRMLPLVAMKAEGVPPFLQGILKNVPYAVLGALIFPAIFVIHTGDLRHITTGDFLFGLIGGAVAFITAYLGWNIIFVVLSSIAILTLSSVLF